jgi:hypothetical protein
MAEQDAGVANGSPSLVPPAPSSPIDTTTATLDDLKKLESSIVNQMKAMMMELVAQKPTPTEDPKASAAEPPPKASQFPLPLHIFMFILLDPWFLSYVLIVFSIYFCDTRHE